MYLTSRGFKIPSAADLFRLSISWLQETLQKINDEFDNIGDIPTYFYKLKDLTPDGSYRGKTGYFVTINSSETGITLSKFIAFTTAQLANNIGKFVKVASNGTSLDFSTFVLQSELTENITEFTTEGAPGSYIYFCDITHNLLSPFVEAIVVTSSDNKRLWPCNITYLNNSTVRLYFLVEPTSAITVRLIG